ncbi:hypothetical protein Lesp02_13780 [Lentzea sp. NBRC 105346]|uniref:hypothetical protein n=1 Tax=Lentzea sp. NBRC 105346 TaxID=3032205 RepID=UPI00249FEEE4|nr:hypothetical protein [Lentzea sp. NBRC 105346]GLZ29188.1 hypothetical protein Lesp02_13780 [Lentzea sp. NBRC 105346]
MTAPHLVPPDGPTVRFERPHRVTRLREDDRPAAPEPRSDLAVVGPLSAFVLALTISTLVLDNPNARVTAAGLAALAMIATVLVMFRGKRPKPGRHVAGDDTVPFR